MDVLLELEWFVGRNARRRWEWDEEGWLLMIWGVMRDGRRRGGWFVEE